MKKKYIFLIIIFLIAVAILFFRNSRVDEITIGKQRFKVETVREKEKLELGLGKRESLCEKCGMLFVFEEKGRHSFWMKDMRFPLDIIWISGGKIVFIKQNVDPDDMEIMTPPDYADRVLEINGGLCAKYGIKIGDEVKT